MPRSAEEIEELFDLGLNFLYGKNGKPKDVLKAYECFTTSAKYGYADAQSQLGDLYYDKNFIHHSDEKAKYWSELAANKGCGDAAATLGIIYEFGDGVDKDSAMAVYWYEKAIEYGFEYAKKPLRRVKKAIKSETPKEPFFIRILPSSRKIAWTIVVGQIALKTAAVGVGVYLAYLLIRFIIGLF